MAQQIIIEGDLVRLVDQVVMKTVALTEWLPSIEKRSPVSTPVLPRATRGVYYDPTNNNNQLMAVLLEVEPQVIHMNFNSRIHDLAIPWTRFIFFCSNRGGSPTTWRMDDYRLFWSNVKYHNADAQDMIPALLPNIYSDGRICFGSTGVNADASIADRLDRTVNEFYATEFNRDLSIHYPRAYRGYTAWKNATRDNPMCWTAWDDFAPESGWSHYSWNMTCGAWSAGSINRTDPVVGADGIPELALGATFGRINQWIAALPAAQQARLRVAAQAIPEDMMADPEANEEDEEN